MKKQAEFISNLLKVYDPIYRLKEKITIVNEKELAKEITSFLSNVESEIKESEEIEQFLNKSVKLADDIYTPNGNLVPKGTTGSILGIGKNRANETIFRVKIPDSNQILFVKRKNVILEAEEAPPPPAETKPKDFILKLNPTDKEIIAKVLTKKNLSPEESKRALELSNWINSLK